MSAAELRCTRERLGLTVPWLVDRLGVSERSAARWEAGVQRVPDGVADAVMSLAAIADLRFDEELARLRRDERPAILTYRTDSDLMRHLSQAWPASWHRALCGRLSEEVDDLRIEYWHG